MSSPALLALVICDGIALAASMVGRLTLPWWIVQSGSVSDLGTYSALLAGGSIVALPIFSPLVDRFRRDLSLRWGLTVGACVPAGLWFIATTGHYNVWILVGFQFIAVAAFALALPAFSAIPSDILGPDAIRIGRHRRPTRWSEKFIDDVSSFDSLAQGLAFQKTAQTLGRLIGPLLGGLLLGTGGIAWALSAQVFLLLVAVMATFSIPQQRRLVTQTSESWLAQVKTGLVVKWKIPLERRCTIAAFFLMSLLNPAIGLMVVLKVDEMGLAAGWLGVFQASLSLGMFASAVWLHRVLIQRLGRYASNAVSLLLVGPMLLLMGIIEDSIPFVIVMAVVGSVITTVQLVGQTHRALAIPPEFRARFAAGSLMTMHLAGIFGSLIAITAIDLTGLKGAYIIFSCGICGVAIFYLLIPGLKYFLSLPHTEVRGFYRRLYPPVSHDSPSGHLS
ncbi:MAG: MFS transporter [Actinomycetota bacterium]